MFVEGDERTNFVFSIPCDAVPEVEIVAVHATSVLAFENCISKRRNANESSSEAKPHECQE